MTPTTRTDRQRAAATKAKRRAAPMLPFGSQHGGQRPGAGRKPKGDRAGVPHDTRSGLATRYPAHVTVKLRQHLRTSSSKRTAAQLSPAACRAC